VAPSSAHRLQCQLHQHRQQQQKQQALSVIVAAGNTLQAHSISYGGNPQHPEHQQPRRDG